MKSVKKPCNVLFHTYKDGTEVRCHKPEGHKMPHEAEGLNVYRWVPKGMKMPKGSR